MSKNASVENNARQQNASSSGIHTVFDRTRCLGRSVATVKQGLPGAPLASFWTKAEGTRLPSFFGDGARIITYIVVTQRYINMPARVRPIEKFAQAVAKCSAEVMLSCLLSLASHNILTRTLTVLSVREMHCV